MVDSISNIEKIYATIHIQGQLDRIPRFIALGTKNTFNHVYVKKQKRFKMKTTFDLLHKNMR